VPAARFLRLDALDHFALAAGVRARALFGDGAMLNLVELDPGAIVPEHSHPHEQLGIVLSGEIVMIVDGEERPCHAMDAMHIPSGVVHGAYGGPEGAVVLDVFVPIREDFRALAGGAQ
jgi:quercetin dioxygenase-like cupin family protein